MVPERVFCEFGIAEAQNHGANLTFGQERGGHQMSHETSNAVVFLISLGKAQSPDRLINTLRKVEIASDMGTIWVFRFHGGNDCAFEI